MSVKTITHDKTVESVTGELKVYTLDGHVEYGNDAVKELFAALRERLLSLGANIKEVPQKVYVAYKGSTNFADVQIQKKAIRVTINVKSGKLDDPKKLAVDFAKLNKGHWGNGDYEIPLHGLDQLPYAMTLTQQAYVASAL